MDEPAQSVRIPPGPSTVTRTPCRSIRSAGCSGLRAVATRECPAVGIAGAPLDPANLPEYAGRLFDRFTDDPVKERLAKWHRLEGDGRAAVEVRAVGLDDPGGGRARRRHPARTPPPGRGRRGGRRPRGLTAAQSSIVQTSVLRSVSGRELQRTEKITVSSGST
ncbi:hypothetical protein [Saccharothrix sp. HUAS TT1]|uniref:hypothetical protein n=1 Tax=unclassified Saccharothrix TaxID=2593673 RepID=UPI00345B861D